MLRVIRCTLVAASITLTGVGCHDATSPPNASPRNTRPTMSLEDNSLTALEVPPHETDPAIAGQWLNNHFVWLDPTADRRQKLFVHLPGTNNVPAQFTLLAKEAARLGYHVIVLMYPNTWAINICSNDPICEENVRLEVIDGIDRSNLIPVTPEHGIYNRLTKLLQYLVDRRLPDEGWSQFLENGEPAWSKIVMSGHSFGGSEATMLAKLHRMDRVTLFASPRDANTAGLPPAWVALGETPGERYYGLVHTRDPLSALTLASWRGPLGMLQFGTEAREDLSASPYGGTHMLLTERLPSTGSFANAHGSVSVDELTPLKKNTDGTPALNPDGTPIPLLIDAWRYLLEAPPTIAPPADLRVSADPGRCDAQVDLGAPTTTGGTPPVTVAASPPGPYGVGTTTVTWTATDGAGNTARAPQRVTVQDQQPPTVTAPQDVSTATDPGQATASVNTGSATATDNCPGVTVVAARNDGQALTAAYPVGQTHITWTGTDASGNTAAAIQTVTVVDQEPPALTVPADFAVNATSPSGAVVSYVASATDNVAGVVPVSCGPVAGSGFAIGTTRVTCMAADPSGNRASATFHVTVLDAPAQLGNLDESVAGLGLPSGIATSLTAKLNAALAAASVGDVVTACTKLQDLINETRAQAGKMIPMTDATLLVTEADRIRAVLGC